MTVSACFFTVTCHLDYDFLLGAIEHHAGMGSHLVLDTSPPDKAIRFRKLPDSVIWLHEPDFGIGWKEFKLRSAIERAMKKARALYADILVYLDSDEFYTKDSSELLFPWAERAMVETQYVHWRKDGLPYTFGQSEWHPRLWPRAADIGICENAFWKTNPAYNGNPEHHPVPVAPAGLPVIRVYGQFRHHLHYALGAKASDEETAVNTIEGWPDKGVRAAQVEWPEKLKLWRDKGVLPSESFR